MQISEIPLPETQRERVDALMVLVPSDYKRIALDFMTMSDNITDHQRRMEIIAKADFYMRLYTAESYKALVLR